jgi:DNA-binding transcriptional LysR family regulator
MISHLRAQVWNWLPAFVAVADTGSIVKAAARLHLTPAAVSRTLRLLESELGEQLFNRVGRALVLNTHGARLRDAVRGALLAVDRGLTDLQASPFSGRLRVASLGVLTEHFVIAALLDLKRAHPGLIPEHFNERAAEANALLARGEIDVAFQYEELSAEGVVVERLGQTTMSVYCGRGHSLFAQRRVTRTQILAHPFSVPQVGDSGRVMDGWPTDVKRQVGMRITLLRSNLEVCASGALLTILPDVTATEGVATGRLRRLPFAGLPPIEVFAARHETASGRGGVQAVIDRVRDRLRRGPGRRAA